MKTVGLYLAAGFSTRMGMDKLNLPTANGPVGSLAFQEAVGSRLEHLFVISRNETVPGWMPEKLLNDPDKAKWTHIFCPDAWKGQAYSIRQGVIEADNFGADAVLILLADQPLITSQLINDLLSLFDDAEKPKPNIGMTSYDGILGPPVVFSSKLFSQLLQLKGDHGAKHALKLEQQKKMMIHADPRLMLDIDNEEDYSRLIEALK